VDGSGEAAAFKAGDSSLAMTGNLRYPAQAAQPGDPLVVYATGIDGATSLSVIVGGIEVAPESISPITGIIGLFQISFRMPQDITPGASATLSLKGKSLNELAVSNEVFIALEQLGDN
jgi:uncharacterized protein (TIGR03437 family)